MAPLPMPLNDFEGHFCCLKPFIACETSPEFTNIARRAVPLRFFWAFCISVLRAFVVLGLVSPVPSQQIGWEKHLRNNLFCVEWDVILTQSCNLVYDVGRRPLLASCHLRSHHGAEEKLKKTLSYWQSRRARSRSTQPPIKHHQCCHWFETRARKQNDI